MLAANLGGLYVLAALACPVGMGVMMLFMGKGMMGGGKSRDQQPAGGTEPSLDTLKAEQARLAEKIAALEAPADDASAAESQRGAGPTVAPIRDPQRTAV